ncbi:MAG: hypothetical protein CGW95_00285 [Phenylobacterium zucineum]|nr:MAG: hypothetical protein CGW95_00285 [Phenylobacterium zucineum]
MSSVDVSIVIATYNRPQQLAQTLMSCLGQSNRLGQVIEIVVVDNHPSQNGGPVVEQMDANSPFPIRYIADPVRNMSALRNRGFTEARGRWVAIIDDDEIADHDWLDELIGTAQARDADIAVGPCLASFSTGCPPAYDPTGAYFKRDLGLKDGSIIDLSHADGKPRYGLGSGNSAFNMARCFPNLEAPMRLEFGDGGGEDSELFLRLHRSGRRIVWAAKAFVTETVPAHRTKIDYRLKRARREAQDYVRLYVDVTPKPALVRTILLAKGMIQVMAGFMIALLTIEFGSELRLRGRLMMAHGMGKLIWTPRVGYISEPGGPTAL